MKIGQFTKGRFKAVWFVWNVATFRALHDVATSDKKLEGFSTFLNTNGVLKDKGVSLVVECHLTDLSTMTIASGFSGCSVEDFFYAPIGMKNSLEKAFEFTKDLVLGLSRADIATFYDGLFKEGTFGKHLKTANFQQGHEHTEEILYRLGEVIHLIAETTPMCGSCVEDEECRIASEESLRDEEKLEELSDHRELD